MTVVARFERMGLVAMAKKAWGLELEPRASSGSADRGFTEEGNAAIVDISGPLLRRAEGLLSLFCDDYESIGARARAAFESGAERVILRIDSPGGDAPGCFELARELRAMAEASGKQLIAYADGAMCCSAAYAIACAADEIVTAPTCYVGSIGVFEALADRTAQTQAIGLRVVVVSSGDEKTDRNPDVPITEDAIARVQAQVDQFAGLFFALVEELRGVGADEVRAMGGGVFLGASAVGVRLADRVSAWSELIAGVGEAEETEMPSTKASKYDEALGAMRRAAEGDDDDAKKAKKCLKAWEDGNDGDEEKKEKTEKDEKSKAKASEEEEKDGGEAKAKSSKAEDEEKKDGEAKARASSADVASIARAEARAEVERAQRAQAEATERAELFAKRPDWDVKMRSTLSKVPIEELRTAVKEWPHRGPMSPAAAASAMPTIQGATQGDLDLALDSETEARMNKLMGSNGKRAPSQAMVYGSFDRDLAKSHVETIDNKETR